MNDHLPPVYDREQLCRPDRFWKVADLDPAIRHLRCIVASGDLTPEKADELLRPLVLNLALSWHQAKGSRDLDLSEKQRNRIIEAIGQMFDSRRPDRWSWSSTGGKNWFLRRFAMAQRQAKLSKFEANTVSVDHTANMAHNPLNTAYTDDHWRVDNPELTSILDRLSGLLPAHTVGDLQMRSAQQLLVFSGVSERGVRISADDRFRAIARADELLNEDAAIGVMADVAAGHASVSLVVELLPMAREMSPENCRVLAGNLARLAVGIGLSRTRVAVRTSLDAAI